MVGRRTSSDNTVKLFGKKAYVLGADKVSQVSKIQGAGIEYCYGDEVTTWQQELFEMLKSRLDKPDSCFDGTCNPDNANHWFKRFLDSGADIYRQRYTIDDNPFLTEDFVDNLKMEYAGTVYYRRFILGEWCAAEGSIYDMFDENRHAVDAILEPVRPEYYVSCDYGTQNAMVFLLWQKAQSGRWYCIREYYYSGRDEQRQKTDAEYLADLKHWLDGITPKAVIIDPSAASFIVLLKQNGFRVKKARNDVLDGIRCVGSQLNAGNIVFLSCCQNAIMEFSSYVWDERAVLRGEDKPLKMNDHCMDAIRYFVYTLMNKDRWVYK